MDFIAWMEGWRLSMTNDLELADKKMLHAKERKKLLNKIIANRYLYLLYLPGAIALLVFEYFPLYGIIIAFKDFNYSLGIVRSPWASMYGMKHFYDLLSDTGFINSFKNTLVISLQRLAFEFPVPIILALLINEVRIKSYKSLVQTIFTLPHFMSWVVVYGIFFNLLSDQGVINELLASIGFARTHLLTQVSTFRGLLYATSNWKEAGWGTIIYLAAISGVDPQLYEAAVVDGAKRKHLMLYITLPTILSVVGIMFILSLSSIMSAGFDQIFNMYNAAVYSKADIIDTYVYRRTFVSGADFASGAAIGLFKSVINFFLLVTGNFIVKKVSGSGIY